MVVVHPAIYDLDLNTTRSCFCSDLDRPSKIRRLGTVSSFLGSARSNRATGAPWPAAQTSSGASCGAQNAMRFLPTWYRLWEELVLWTYHGEIVPREAGDGEVARAVFNDGGDGIWQLSGSKDSGDGGGVGGGSSSKWWISAGGSGSVARRQRRGSVMVARVWPNSHGIGHYL
jgi:hypothetical protein